MTVALCENLPMTSEQEAARQQAISTKAELDQLKAEETALKERIRKARIAVGWAILEARRVSVSQAELVTDLKEQRETLRRWENEAKNAQES